MTKFLAIIAAALLPFTAFAHGPSPQKVEKIITVKADPAKVWAAVKDMEKWHPEISATKIKSTDEDLMKLKYNFADGKIAATDINSYLKVKGGDSETTIKWVTRFYRVYKLNPPIPEGQDDESAVKAVEGIVDAGAAELQKLIESK